MKIYEITYRKKCRDGSICIMTPWLDKKTGMYALSPDNKRKNYIFVVEEEIIPTMMANPKLMLRVGIKGQPTSLICLSSLDVVEIGEEND